MFDRFLIYARARRALGQGQFEAALRLVSDPAVADERRAQQIREKALAGKLERARRRLAGGQLEAAGEDVADVLGRDPEFDGAASLQAAIAATAEQRIDRQTAARELRQQVRQRVAEGDLAGARRACDEAAAIDPEAGDQAAVERLVVGLQQACADDLSGAEAAVAAGDTAALRRHLARLRQPSDSAAGTATLRQRAAGLFAAEHAAALGRDGDERAILDQVAADRAHCPALLAEPVLARVLTERARQHAVTVQARLTAGELTAAVAGFRAVHPVLREAAPLGGLADGLEALAAGCEARACGDLGRALEQLGLAADGLGGKALRRQVEELAAAERRAVQALAASREHAAGGRLLAAREQISPVLEEWPMHEPLRRQMDLLNQQAGDREERLGQARELAREGRLAAASALLLGLSGEGDEGREARLLLKDVDRRMDLAAEGLAQVRRAVHGPGSSREGLRHCIARLDEIAKIQADQEELASLRSALQAEIRGLDLLDDLSGAVAAGDLPRVRSGIEAFQAARPEMMRPDRLDARFLDLADSILQRADSGVHNARLGEAAAWVGVVRGAAAGRHGLDSRIQGLEATIEEQQARAQRLLERLDESSASGDLAAAGDLIEAARGLWADCPQLVRIEHRVGALQKHAQAVEEIEQLTGAGDVREAHRRLGAMPPTPGFLRTRIFDIKQGLARAQGLEQGFLLRVDEGGEYLVLREDTLTIGNVRDAKADLRVLANIAGVHARFKRSLSFHGGMEDRIVAEKGPVFVNGQQVDAAVLRSGDRVRLGPTFEFVYTVPGKRSLSAILQLKSGFQVAGADKVLLLKDRGRDGRVLIGRADDAHIRVPHDEAEVELFSASDGQIRVRYGGKGEIGGKPFSGSHPVTAGALVRCGKTSFVLQPWQP